MRLAEGPRVASGYDETSTMYDRDQDVTELIDRIGAPVVDEARAVPVGTSGGTIIARVIEWRCGCWATKATPRFVRYVGEPLMFESCSFNHGRTVSSTPGVDRASVSNEQDAFESIVTSMDFPLFV